MRTQCDTNQTAQSTEKRKWPSRDCLVLHLIGWESGVSFLDQSQREVKQHQFNPRILSTLNWKMLGDVKV